MFATAKYGNGKVAAIGDSSPCDDGTGASGESLYNGYTGDVGQEHRYLLMNATIWLAAHKAKSTTEIDSPKEQDFKLYPNPVIDGKLNISYFGSDFVPSNVQIMDLTGKMVQSIELNNKVSGLQSLNISMLRSGAYLCRFYNGKDIQTRIITVLN